MATTLLISLLLLASFGCGAAMREGGSPSEPSAQTSDKSASGADVSVAANRAAQPGGSAEQSKGAVQQVSLTQADQSQAAPVPSARKIIRNAQLTLELDAPAEAARKVASIAESRGGFVVTSESRQQGGSDNYKPYEVVTVELRVPAAQFDAVVAEIRGVGGQVTDEKTTGQDVTEEYIDLEAQIRTKKALEAQFLEIMKTADTVSEALEVQRELASVRTEIERVEGRRRFLENQTSLSTIKVTLRPPAPLVSTTGFFHSIKSAFGDGIDAAAAIILVLIRVAIALIPILLLIVLPIVLLIRFALRRFRRRAAPLQ
jgi:hypothetical protein